MFYGAGKNTFEKAHLLRNSMTEAEKLLWNKLKNRDLRVKFRRQHPIGNFIVDFYCHELKLVIELDGGIHLRKEINEYDKGRSHDIEKYGIRILRFTNDEIFSNLPTVLDQIVRVIRESEPPSGGRG
jgi:cyclase